MNYAAFKKVIWFEWKDFQFSILRPVLGLGMGFLSKVFFVFGLSRTGSQFLLAASRYTDSRFFSKEIARRMEHVVSYSRGEVARGRRWNLDDFSSRCLEVAAPKLSNGRVIRKGVIIVTFSENIGGFYSFFDADKVLDNYILVFEPSWAGYAEPNILCWAGFENKIIVQSTEKKDREFIDFINENLIPVSYGAGDWIDPEVFYPVNGEEKIYDVIAVANFGWWKRVHSFLKAIRNALREDPEFKACLVLARFGGEGQADIENMVKFYRLESALEIFYSVDREELRILYSRSRSLYFSSLKEGSSRVIFEAMCCDIPVIVLNKNVGVNKDYINKNTGVLLEDWEVGRFLVNVKNKRALDCCSPRDWYVENLGPANTIKKLVRDLNSIAENQEWKEADFLIKSNSPELCVSGVSGFELSEKMKSILARYVRKN